MLVPKSSLKAQTLSTSEQEGLRKGVSLSRDIFSCSLLEAAHREVICFPPPELLYLSSLPLSG